MSDFDPENWRADESQKHIYNLLLSFARRRLHSHNMSFLEDIVQDCHVAVNEFLERKEELGEPAKSISAICSKVLSYKLVDHQRRQKVKRRRVAEVPIDFVPPERLGAVFDYPFTKSIEAHLTEINNLIEVFFQGHELIIVRKMRYVKTRAELMKLTGLSRSHLQRKIRDVQQKMPEFLEALRELLEEGGAK